MLEHLSEQLFLLDQWFEKGRDFASESNMSAADIIQQHLNTLSEGDIERCIWGECGILADQLMALLQAAGYREAVYEIGRAYIHPFEEYDDKTYIGGHVVVTVEGESYDALGAGAKKRWVEGPVVQEISGREWLCRPRTFALGPPHRVMDYLDLGRSDGNSPSLVFRSRSFGRFKIIGRLIKRPNQLELVKGVERKMLGRVRDLDQSLPVSFNLPHDPSKTCPLCLTYFTKGFLGHLCRDCDLRRKQEHEVHPLMVELVKQAPKLDEFGDGVVKVGLEIPTNSAGDFYQEIDVFDEVTWTDLILDLPGDYYANERYFIPHVIETLERAQTEPGRLDSFVVD